MAQERKRQVLGRGLGALIPGGGAEAGESAGDLLMVPIGEVFPNPNQPRRKFAHSALEELAASIREKGVLQPVLVHRVPGGFELVAGERRWRAAKMAGLEKIPAQVKKIADKEILEIALIENLQREDLNPLEEAQAYRDLMDLYGYTQEEVARRVGKDRATVANALRLLALPDFARDELFKGTITGGHARALLGTPGEREMEILLGKVLSRGLSVRETERAAAALGSKTAEKKGNGGKGDPEMADLVKRLERRLGAKVRIQSGKKGGRVEISFGGMDELNGLVDILLGRK